MKPDVASSPHEADAKIVHIHVCTPTVLEATAVSHSLAIPWPQQASVTNHNEYLSWLKELAVTRVKDDLKSSESGRIDERAADAVCAGGVTKAKGKTRRGKGPVEN